MGDNDGPAVVIYSEQGYNKAEMEVALSQIDIHNIRSDGGSSPATSSSG